MSPEGSSSLSLQGQPQTALQWGDPPWPDHPGPGRGNTHLVSNLLLWLPTAFQDLLKLGPATALSPPQSHGTAPLGSLRLLGFCPCCSSACSLASDLCPSGFHLAGTSSREPSLNTFLLPRAPPRPSAQPGAGALLCSHSCRYSLHGGIPHLGSNGQSQGSPCTPTA